MERKRRYGLTPEAWKRPIFPHPATIELLETIYEHEPVRTSHLYQLYPDRSQNGLIRSIGILHRSAAVTKEGDDISELVRPVDYYSSDILHLTDKGARFLRNYREPDKVVNLYRPRGDFRLEREHKLGISDTLTNIRAAVMRSPVAFISQGRIERDFEKEGDKPLCLPASVTTTIKGRKYDWEGLVTPDGLFGLEYPDGTRKYVALEYQRAGKVEPNKLYGVSSMRRKYLAYADIAKSKVYKELWGVRNLTVLFVFSTQQKYNQSIKLAEELFPNGAPMFLHHCAPEFRVSDKGYIKDPEPDLELLTRPLHRVGLPPIALYDAERDLP